MPSLVVPSFLLMVVVSVLGLVDGFYFHIWKFRLHERPQSRREHVIHSIRMTLVIPAVYGLFVAPATGVLLWGVAAVVAADFFVMLWDLFEESASRRDLGGIPRAEYIIHVVATGLHASSCALGLASRPLGAWTGELVAVELPASVVVSAQVACVMAAGAAALHFALLHPRIAGLRSRLATG